MNQIKVKDIVNHLNKIADPGLAYDWDNVGFQLGDAEAEVKKILLTLDVTENAIKKAIKENIDLIISHHPFIFRPIKKITNPLYLKLIKNNISVFCAHTNLDVIKKGVNFALADKLGLKNLVFLSSESGSNIFYVSVLVPSDFIKIISDAVCKEGALNPHVFDEKLEFFVDSFNLNRVIEAMKSSHPNETPTFAVYPQEKQNENYGLGLIGELTEKMSIKDFSKKVKMGLEAPFIKLWLADKTQQDFVKKISVCGGSGSSVIPKVYGKADVLVSADFTYHTILDSRIPLIDAGHFYTENPVLENLREMLSEFDVEIVKLKAEEHEIQKEIIIL